MINGFIIAMVDSRSRTRPRIHLIIFFSFLMIIVNPNADASSSWDDIPTVLHASTIIDVNTKYHCVQLDYVNGTYMNWSLMPKNGDQPEPRELAGMAYDKANKLIVMFGGDRDTPDGRMNDTWVYNTSNNTWKRMYPLISPSARIGPAFVYDEQNEVVVLFGGQGIGNQTYLNDTWKYDVKENVWTQMDPMITPPARATMRMVYNSAEKKIIMFGGGAWPHIFNDTWSYNTNTNSWINMQPLSAPPERYCFGLVYDESINKVLLYGGCNFSLAGLGDVWSYDIITNTWENLINSYSRETAGINMVYDCINYQTVVCGGIFYDLGTWTFHSDDKMWYLENSLANPSPRWNPAMAYDCDNRLIVLFSGLGEDNDTWVCSLLKEYKDNGTYISRPFDTGGSAYYGSLHWNVTSPVGTSIQIQLRTADTEADINQEQFCGPDGTNGTFYENNNLNISNVHNSSRWIQYKVYLSTTTYTLTPRLKDLSIYYNLCHNITITSPTNDDNWTGVQNVRWLASDLDNDGINFVIELIDTNSTMIMDSDRINGTNTWPLNTTNISNGKYRIRILAKDNNQLIPLSVTATSDEFIVFHPDPKDVRNNTPRTIIIESLFSISIIAIILVIVAALGIFVIWNRSQHQRERKNI